ncbi:hypothetical protein [Salinispora arenicola]|uniref:hypothetical protein n=1 Tax=Salinispora arenicola TaxID=168697 RepID=UPI000379A4EA|nr:hypothetical protein [Salinispora arenicola]
MGAAVAAQLQRHEITVLWRPAGRSDTTTHRATAAGLTATTDLTEPLERSHIVLSIYPPAAAEDIATTVAAQAYVGIYVDANAISPSRMRHIATTLTATGTTVIDAATIGPPPINGAATRIYLAGDHTDTTAALFADTTITPVVLNEPVGAASALNGLRHVYQHQLDADDLPGEPANVDVVVARWPARLRGPQALVTRMVRRLRPGDGSSSPTSPTPLQRSHRATDEPGMLDTSGMLIDTVTRQIRDTVTGCGSWTAAPETLLLHNGMAGYCAHTSVETWSGGNPAITELLHKDPEHYRPQFGDIPPDLDYVWPRSDRSTAEEDGSWPRGTGGGRGRGDEGLSDERFTVPRTRTAPDASAATDPCPCASRVSRRRAGSASVGRCCLGYPWRSPSTVDGATGDRGVPLLPTG